MKTIRLLGFLMLFSALGGCAVFSGSPKPCDCRNGASSSNSNIRSQLNAGYSLLYSGATGLSKTDLVLYVKVESDDVQKVVDDISNYDDSLKKRLEKIAKDFPAVDIGLKPLPTMERRAQDAGRDARLKDFAPLIGQTGARYERTLLLTLSGLLIHERFLAQVMAEAEPNPALKKILQNAESRYIDLYNEVVKLLNAQYFKTDSYQPVTQSS